MDLFRRWDPLLMTGAVAALFLAISDSPWWSLTGAATNSLMTFQVSPYYLHTDATGLVSTLPFAEFLGPITRLLLVIALAALVLSSFRPWAWWHDLSVYFGLSVLVELYLSFLLNYHAAETLLLGAYGIVPPGSGTSRLPAVVTGLDLTAYAQPLVAAGFSLPFYVGFLSLGLVCASMVLRHHGARTRIMVPKGLEAIFTTEHE